MSAVNKVDMSLDDIIKLNKKQGGRGQGRGRLGRGLGRGGRGNKIKQFRTNLQRGGGKTRGQGLGRGGQGRGGRGRLRRLSSGISPLNRPQDQTSNTASSPNKQQKQSLKQQRLNAVFALRKAKQQLARIDAQATRRQEVVSQRRGLQQQTSQQNYQYQNRVRGGGGRGRGRGGRGRLGRQQYNNRQQNQNYNTYNQNVTTYTGGRGRGRLRRLGQNYSSNLSLNSTNVSTGSGNRKKRQWRRRPEQTESLNDGILTISLPNSDYQPPVQQTSSSKKFNYNKRLFAQSGTNVSLSERFNQDSTNETGRQVFL